MAFQELMETGGAEEKQELQKLQNELQSDDPVNIQFTSVSKYFLLKFLLNPLSIVSAVITGMILLHVDNYPALEL